MAQLFSFGHMSALLYLLTMFASIAAVEFCVLRRCFGRRSLAVCVFSVAIPSGIFWTAVTWMLTAIGVSWKAASEPSLTGANYFGLSFFFVVWVLILSIVALIPAGLTAMIYRRFRSEL